jgi:ribosomal protein S18 acetylase RimI-like enzyme
MAEAQRVRVRVVRRQDASQFVDLRIRFLGESGRDEPRLRTHHDARERTEAMLPVWLEQRGLLLYVAEDAEDTTRLVGYAMGQIETLPPLLARQHVGDLLELYVLPEARGAGVGPALLAVIQGALANRGAEVLRARVATVNQHARDRLERAGYRPLQVTLERRLTAD